MSLVIYLGKRLRQVQPFENAETRQIHTKNRQTKGKKKYLRHLLVALYLSLFIRKLCVFNTRIRV